jgi:hypothetical protein
MSVPMSVSKITGVGACFAAPCANAAAPASSMATNTNPVLRI